jgi:hypothetical protein
MPASLSVRPSCRVHSWSWPFQHLAAADDLLAVGLEAVGLGELAPEDDAGFGFVDAPAELEDGLAAARLPAVEQDVGFGEVRVGLRSRVRHQDHVTRRGVDLLGDSLADRLGLLVDPVDELVEEALRPRAV